ncbi:Thioesterase/thiol ester dehydrase-isomerase [Mycena floridula]|nr:Thioesterase/thiol ester dehydrase-isomerase [Mycena floridula]
MSNVLRRCHWAQIRRNSSIKALQAAFRDPDSPFHIPPGSVGPASPDEVPDFSVSPLPEPATSLEQARRRMIVAGFHPNSFHEQKIVWGDLDSFQHVNNVRYVRFFESSRIGWMRQLGQHLGGPSQADNMVRGKGISLILKSIAVRFRRPVLFPDTLLVAHRAIPAPESDQDPASLYLTASAFSLNQQAFVAHADEVTVWYDYDTLKKADPSERYRQAVFRKE